MLRPTVPLLLAALLLLPVAAPAQTPPPAKATPQKVSIQVAFVTVKTEDLDALGINFNLIPLPASPRTFLVFAEGNIVPQLYQTLTRAAHIGSHTIVLAPIAVSDNVSAVFTVNTKVPIDAAPMAMDQGRSGFPQLTGSGQLRGKITIIPRIMPGNAVRLDMLSPVGSSQRMRFRTTPSGQQVVMNATVFAKSLNSNNQGQIEGFSGHSTVSHTTELLIFITPTIVTQTVMAAPVPEKIVTETKTFVSPTHFLGAAAGNSFAGTTFGDPVPGNYGDASSGLLGFGMTKPSDIFRSSLWLDSSHWQSRSHKTGTMSTSPVIKVPPLPSGVKRIYAL